MMKKIAILWGALMMATTLSAQNATQQVLSTTQKVNDYFMAKYADPTLPTNVKKVRPSNLWTRAVYDEGLMALNEIENQLSITFSLFLFLINFLVNRSSYLSSP